MENEYMTQSLRHYGIYKPTNQELIILGYRPSTNKVLVVVLDRIAGAEKTDLLRILNTRPAQSVDYLMKSTDEKKSILSSVFHITNVTQTWESILVTRGMTKADKQVVEVPLDKVEFANQDQLNYFMGKGETIEKEESKVQEASPQNAQQMENIAELLSDLGNRLERLEAGKEQEEASAAPKAKRGRPKKAKESASETAAAA